MSANDSNFAEKVTILIVEDSPTQALKLQHVLERHNFAVLCEPDGVRALEAMAVCAPTLVITDVNMPNMDGITLCKELRGLPLYKGIPILILTTESAVETKSRGKLAGATGWIVKPFNPDQLLATIAKVL